MTRRTLAVTTLVVLVSGAVSAGFAGDPAGQQVASPHTREILSRYSRTNQKKGPLCGAFER